MMELTGETFSASLLERSRFRDVYFDGAGESILFKFPTMACIIIIMKEIYFILGF
jgi:hypothetical protein